MARVGRSNSTVKGADWGVTSTEGLGISCRAMVYPPTPLPYLHLLTMLNDFGKLSHGTIVCRRGQTETPTKANIFYETDPSQSSFT